MTAEAINGNSPSSGPLPSAPTPGLVLFNSEEQSDIVFNISSDPNGSEGWRFPAHSFIIENASSALKQIIEKKRQQISTTDAPRPEIFVRCKPEIFILMMSYAYKREISMNSVSKCLDLYSLSKKFEFHDLTLNTLTFLNTHVSEYNVLEIITHLRNECNDCELNNSMNNDNTLNELIAKCFHILDENAEFVLKSYEFVNIDQSTLIEVLSRGTLNVSSELSVFDAVEKWSDQQCLKRRLEVNPDNKRKLLGDALYCVKYLVMSWNEFLRGPYLSDLLTNEEKNCLMLKKKGAEVDLPKYLDEYYLKAKRCFADSCAIVSPVRRDSQISIVSDLQSNALLLANSKKSSASKKLKRGLQEFAICFIQLLD
ncbi:BTB/POZ domain-containing protein 2-like protein [Dinothrombium tinctorium]|uniref:BTB/POZ domain-containing protein 2-like protein n=1 Tax=Dinothrombium tinctorium TaxID=1965070 RepID=A0A3S3SF03_9ACAR|nr:BTB/POZ domain-containing protein 2-like protein [Dinothrombium tinctorium]RWS12892.1 BTB/POZ domain-containing protein 2-like protein [Dinothrombium tinctorium]RWS14405.1 BTB/POZ domain-containing protein 2-like protein [Dinothrombium tinctorium]RWS14406.1 BTB/POZ domain-containing protein 2-like protein [Dinothrombium tinctorium]